MVHKTGGLADSITDYNLKKGTGNGFVFTQYTVEAMIEALQRAISLYRDEERWEGLLQSIMAEDNSWKGIGRAVRGEDVQEGIIRRIPSG